MLCKNCKAENEDWREICKNCGAALKDEGFPFTIAAAYVLLALLGVFSAITGINILAGNSVIKNRTVAIIFFMPLILAVVIGYPLFISKLLRSLRRE